MNADMNAEFEELNREFPGESYFVTINYTNLDRTSPLYRKIRTTTRRYTAVTGPEAVAVARKNFLGSRHSSIRILSTDVHDSDGRYAY